MKKLLIIIFIFACVVLNAQVVKPVDVRKNYTKPDFQASVNVEDTLGVSLLMADSIISDYIQGLIINNLVKTSTNYTPTDANDYIIFTNTTVRDTCFLTGLTAGKVLTIRRKDITNDVVINADSLIIDGAADDGYYHSYIYNYNMTATTRSVVVISEGNNVYDIIMITN